ncbi:MAG TPA: tetratricopeptide repeat protein, partial [Flavisolibacter sp.]
MRTVSCLFVFLFSILLLAGPSQTNGPYDPQVLAQYRQGNKYYEEALHQSQNDKEEERFNRLALINFSSVLQHVPSTASVADTIRFFSAVKAGELESYFDSSAKALEYYKLALDMPVQGMRLSDSVLFKPYVFAGIIYYTQSRTDSAVNYFRKAEALQLRYKAKLQESERLFNMLGAVYYESGNYYQAKNYFQKATDVLPEDHPFYKGLFVNYKINLATVLLKLEQYDTAYKIFHELLPYRLYQNEIYNNIGLIHLRSGSPAQAIDYFKKVNYQNRLEVGLCNDMASAYYDLKNYPAARRYLQLAVAKNAIYYRNEKNIDLGLSFKLIGDIEKETKDYSNALVLYQQALNQLFPSFTGSSVESVPSNYSGVFSFIDVFNVLVAKAEAWHSLYRQYGRLQDAVNELKTYQSALALVSYVEKTYDSDQARLFLGKIKYTIHSSPVEIAYELYSKTGERRYFEDLYSFDQLNKASVLAFNRQLSNLAQKSNSPLLQNVQDLKTRITRLSIKANGVADSVERTGIATEIRNLEMDLGKKQELLSKEISFQGNTIPPINDLQSSVLDNETAIISYTLSGEKLTTTVIMKDSSFPLQRNLPAGFHEELKTYIGSLVSAKGSFSKALSNELYSNLLGQLRLEKIKHLVIIPDNELCYLPFESLVDAKGNWIIGKYSVQYQYCTSVLKKDPVNFEGHQSLSFAPFSSSGLGGFERLPNSLSEIEKLKGEKLTDTSANKANLLKHIADYKVLHLATHAV